MGEGWGIKISPSPFYENPTKKSPATRGKFHHARGHKPEAVEFQHKIALVVEPIGRSLAILRYGTIPAAESTGVISVLLYMTDVEVSSFLVACGKSFTTWLESDPTRRLWALPNLDTIFREVGALDRPRQTK